MSDATIYLGLDVHQDSITVAALPAGAPAPTRVERLPNDLAKLQQFCERLATQGDLRACYEASGAGYVLHRAMREWGYPLAMIAPSLIPSKPGQQRKHDAAQLARLYRAGEITLEVALRPDNKSLQPLVITAADREASAIPLTRRAPGRDLRPSPAHVYRRTQKGGGRLFRAGVASFLSKGVLSEGGARRGFLIRSLHESSATSSLPRGVSAASGATPPAARSRAIWYRAPARSPGGPESAGVMP